MSTTPTPLDPDTTYCWFFDQGMSAYCGSGDAYEPFVMTPDQALDYLLDEAADYLATMADMNDEIDDGWEPGMGTEIETPDELRQRHAGDVAMIEGVRKAADLRGDTLAACLRERGVGLMLDSGNRGYGWWMEVRTTDEFAVCDECGEPYDVSTRKCDCGAYYGKHYTERLGRFGGEPICACGFHCCEYLEADDDEGEV